MENRFSTMTEVRNVAVAGLRDAGVRRSATSCRASRARWNCSTARRWRSRSWPEEATGHPVAVFQRIDQAGYKLPIDERILADTDTLMVFGLDHLLSEQEAAPEEIAAIKRMAASAKAPACCWRRITTSGSPTT